MKKGKKRFGRCRSRIHGKAVCATIMTNRFALPGLQVEEALARANRKKTSSLQAERAVGQAHAPDWEYTSSGKPVSQEEIGLAVDPGRSMQRCRKQIR